jgi:hypothetical protein
VNNIVEPVLKTVQVLSVVVAAVISIWSFNATREKEAEARRVEAIKPMVELRQKFYLEAARAASILADPGVYSKNEILSARKRFRQLYIVELSMVESGEVESQMVAFAKIVDPTLTNLTEAQRAAYNLAHGLASSFIATKEPR